MGLKPNTTVSAALLYLLASSSSLAQSWDNEALDEDWFNPLNWDANTLPDGTVDVIVDTSGEVVTVTDQDPDATAQTKDLILGSTAGANGILTVEDGGMVNSSASFIGNASGSEGAVTVTGAGSMWTNSNALYLGYEGNGTLTVENGGTVTSNNSLVGMLAGSQGVVSISGSGSSWTTSSAFVGVSGSGTVTVEDGGAVSTDLTYLAVAPGSEGMVTVSGAGSTWTSTGLVYIGTADAGTLIVENGGAVDAGSVFAIGQEAGSAKGYVEVSGGGSRLTGQQLIIGSLENATLVVQDGGLVEVDGGNGNITMSQFAGSVGSLVIGADPNLPGYDPLTDLTAPGTVSAGMIDFSDGTNSLIFNHSDNSGDYSFSPDLTGGGASMIEHLAGYTNLTGDGSGFTGTTYVEGGTLAITGGGMLGGDTGYIGYAAGSDGAVLVSGAGSNWTNNNILFLGHGGNGALTIEDGGTVTNGTLFVGLLPGSQATATVSGSGASLTNDNLYIGQGGNGALTVEDGGTVTNDYLFMGLEPGSQGSATVSGSGSSWTNGIINGISYVGLSGSGTVTVEDGGAFATRRTILASTQESEGVVTVSGAGSTWTNSNNLSIGYGGKGAVTVEDGGTVVNGGDVHVAENAGANGAIEVTGAGSSLTIAGELFVGREGNATLSVEDGGAVSNSIGRIGFNPGSEGTATVTGAGSMWTNSTDLYLGYAGNGTLTVEDGGTVTNTEAYMGLLAGSQSGATVSGSGSSWTSSTVYVGMSGTGIVTVEDGGAVTSTLAFIATSSGSEGMVTVSGAGSTWTNTGNVFVVGDTGSGTLIVEDGGAVDTAVNFYIAQEFGSAKGYVQVTGGGSRLTGQQLIIGSLENATLVVQDGGLVDVDGGNGNITMSQFADSVGSLVIGADPNLPGYDPLTDLTAPGTVSAGMIDFVDGTNSLIFNHSDNSGDYIFSPDLIGGGASMIEQLAGYTNLTGDGSGFAGATNIYGGTLAVENMLGGQVNVMSGGTLGGSGTATGDVTFNDGSYYRVEMDGTTAAQGLTVQGAATLDGTVMLTGDYASIAGAGPVVIMTIENTSFTGFFDGAETPSIFLTPTLTLGTDIFTTYVLASVEQTTAFADVAETPNQRSLAGALDTLPNGTPLASALLMSETVEEARDAYNQLLGEAHSSLKGALVENGQQAVKAVNDRIHAAFEADANTSVSAYGDTADPANGFWITGYGDWMTTDATGNTAEMSNNLYGVIAGIDRRFGDYGRLGVLGGYSRTNTSIDALASQADADSYTIGVYGGADNGNAALSLGALYTWHSIDSTRHVTNPVTEMLNADYNARSFQLFAEAGYKATMDRLTLEPFAGVSYINLNTDSFSETGGVAALSSSSETTSTTFTTLGLRSSIELASNVSTRGMVGWRHAFGDVDPASTFTVGGSGPFSILGAPIAQDAAVVEAGIDIEAGENVTIGASYEGQYGDGAIANGFNARLLAEF